MSNDKSVADRLLFFASPLFQVTNLTDDAISALFVRTSLERIHLSYCDRISVNAINALLSHLNRLTHLSLTGVAAFRRPDLQKYCRPAPKVSFDWHVERMWGLLIPLASIRTSTRINAPLSVFIPEKGSQNSDAISGSCSMTTLEQSWNPMISERQLHTLRIDYELQSTTILAAINIVLQ